MAVSATGEQTLPEQAGAHLVLVPCADAEERVVQLVRGMIGTPWAARDPGLRFPYKENAMAYQELEGA